MACCDLDRRGAGEPPRVGAETGLVVVALLVVVDVVDGPVVVVGDSPGIQVIEPFAARIGALIGVVVVVVVTVIV